MINLRHIKFLGIVIFSLLLFSQSFADKKFDKDLKILSKFNSFINNKGESYATDVKFDKDKKIIVIYAHGQLTDRREKCTKKWNKVPPAIYQLDGITINNLTVRIYHLCYGIGRSWTEKEQDYFWGVYSKSNHDPKSILNLKDKKGELLINKNEIWRRTKAMKLKVDEFVAKGFNNIVLSGISAGAWTSLVLKSDFPDLIDGVVAFTPGRSGKFAKAKSPNKAWVNWRNYKNSLIKTDKLDNYKIRPLQEVETPVASPQETAAEPNVDPKALDWAEKNPWYGSNDEMTAMAMVTHDRLAKQGTDLQSDEYYEAINTRMRQLFPDEFEDVAITEAEKPKRRLSVVAPATRSTSPKKVTLSQTQVALAKRLGVTLEDYAEQVAELMRKQN